MTRKKIKNEKRKRHVAQTSYLIGQFLNFVSNSFITLRFSFRFNPTRDQLRLDQGPTRERIKVRKKEIDYPTTLTYCGCVHYSSCKFCGLTHVNTICRCLFISIHIFYDLILEQFVILY
jgi:hypothetical protein